MDLQPTKLKQYMPDEINTIYSPLGILKFFENTVEEVGDVDKVLKDKKKYKRLVEMYNAVPFALIFKKFFNREFWICSDDAPDLNFVDPDKRQGFQVEMMEYHEDLGHDYDKIARFLWEKKGKKHFPGCHLVIVCRTNLQHFNMTELTKAMAKYSWFFTNIWFDVFQEAQYKHIFFELHPPKDDYTPVALAVEMLKEKAIFY